MGGKIKEPCIYSLPLCQVDAVDQATTSVAIVAAEAWCNLPIFHLVWQEAHATMQEMLPQIRCSSRPLGPTFLASPGKVTLTFLQSFWVESPCLPGMQALALRRPRVRMVLEHIHTTNL